MFNFWWLAKWSKQQKSFEMQKRPPKSSKNEMLSFGLRSTSDDQPSDLSDKNWLKCEKSPLSHHKMKCSFLDYVQLLMIGHAIRAMKVGTKCDKRPPKSLNNEMVIFGLYSNSVDWLCNPSNKSQLKCRKRPPKSLKNEILIFILCSTSDDRPSNPSDKSWSKCKKNVMLFQLGSSVVSVWVFCCFSLGLLYAPPSWWQGRN